MFCKKKFPIEGPIGNFYFYSNYLWCLINPNALDISITSSGNNESAIPTIYNHQEIYAIPKTVFTPGIKRTIAVRSVHTPKERFIVLLENKPTLNNECEDTLLIARKKLPWLSNHKLNTVCAHFGIEFRHHRALSDAFATAEALIELSKF